MPSTDAVRIVTMEESENGTVSDVGREDNPLCAGHHGGDDLTLDKLGGLECLEEALDEQTSYMESAQTNAMVSVRNEVVFTELDTLLTVAREAIRKIVGNLARFAEEARDWTPERELPMDTKHRVEPHPGKAQVEPLESTGYGREGPEVAPEDENRALFIWPEKDGGANFLGCRKFSTPCSFYCTEDARSNFENLQKFLKFGFFGHILFELFQNKSCYNYNNKFSFTLCKKSYSIDDNNKV